MIAWTALITWPVVVLFLFRWTKPATALAVAFIGGYLLLPERVSYDLPMLPALNKGTIPALAALIAALIFVPRDKMLAGWLPRNKVLLTCMFFFVFGHFGTVLTNTDFIFSGLARTGLTFYDGASRALSAMMALIPFLLARRILSTDEALGRFLLVFVAAALGYSLLALYEVRMSPQLNNQIYGFFPHSWHQHIRGDGFRPLVFLEHGLRLALFLAMAIVAAVGLVRIKHRAFGFAAVWLLGVLVLAKSLGALIIAVVIAPLALLLNRRNQILAAACIAGAILAYPPLRSAGVAPVDKVLSLAEAIDSERAQSFRTRVESETVLLERAAERPIFGWGGYGRERAYDSDGRELSISDGFWIISLGQSGWVGYIGQMGLFGWVLIALGFTRRPLPAVSAVAALVLAANLIDLVPNSGATALTWMLAGGLAGLYERMKAGQSETISDSAKVTPRKTPVLRRDFDDTPSRPAATASVRTTRDHRREYAERTSHRRT